MNPRAPIAWLIAGIVALVLVNVASDPAFLKITVQDGHLYGVTQAVAKLF